MQSRIGSGDVDGNGESGEGWSVPYGVFLREMDSRSFPLKSKGTERKPIKANRGVADEITNLASERGPVTG